MRRFIPRTVKHTGPAAPPPPSPPPSPPPEPAAKRPRVDAPELDAAAMNRLRKGFEREMRNAMDDAKDNTFIMEDFSFQRACSNKKQLKTTNLTRHDWMDNTPRRGVSNDGVTLIIHLPGIIKPKSTGLLLDTLVDFAETGLGGKLPKSPGADKQGRDAASSYKDVLGQIAGLFKLVKAWHAIGHEHDNPTVSSHMLKSGRAFSASLDLINQLHLVSHRVNAMLQYGDEPYWECSKELRAKAESMFKFLKVIGSDDPLVMEGRELMYNRQTPLHPDKSDHKRGWAVLVVVGPFTGGALHILCLNLRMRYTDGTMIMVRSKILPHEVEAFSDGQHVCIAHFTHRSLWKVCGLEPPYPPGMEP
ncbi:hypothetical protein FB451DRAFT_1161681 [Mycena latifolia]|nr:hypothetical protein FB451DRAFT_1161681 [Mycena latifolia]